MFNATLYGFVLKIIKQFLLLKFINFFLNVWHLKEKVVANSPKKLRSSILEQVTETCGGWLRRIVHIFEKFCALTTLSYIIIDHIVIVHPQRDIHQFRFEIIKDKLLSAESMFGWVVIRFSWPRCLPIRRDYKESPCVPASL